jgi:REP element-mobilizing transposase RayT
MANTYTQLTVQFVFAVKFRQSLISDDFREILHKYITGIIQNQSNKLLAINSMPDHIHILIGLNPQISISNLVRDIKSDSSKFINENNLSKFQFNWQEGYGAFSYSHSHRKNVIEYILKQQEHHKKQSFKDEYLDFLKKFEIDFKEPYLFEWI